VVFIDAKTQAVLPLRRRRSIDSVTPSPTLDNQLEDLFPIEAVGQCGNVEMEEGVRAKFKIVMIIPNLLLLQVDLVFQIAQFVYWGMQCSKTLVIKLYYLFLFILLLITCL